MLNKIADAFRLYKFGIFKIYLNKLLPKHLQFQHFLLYQKDLNNLDVYEPENNISFKRVNEVDDPLFVKFQERFPAAEFEKRIQQPDKICYIAFQNDDVAGYGWAAKQEL